MNKDTIIVGDTHGVWGPLNILINKKKPKIVLQVGDFGWWPKFHNTSMVYSGEYEEVSSEIVDDPWDRVIRRRTQKKWDQFGLKPQSCKVYWCDGNHEDHWDLRDERNYMKAPCETMPGVYYMKRGSTLTLPDDRVVLFMGGADSIDKKYRKVGFDWFPEEVINYRDIYELPDVAVDIVISHTCPTEFQPAIMRVTHWGGNGYEKKIKDPSAQALSAVLEKYKPDQWFFGHFHMFLRGKHLNTNWCCLNMARETGWWTYLE